MFDKNKTDYFKDFLDYGGDDTVPNWSSLLTGFKWLYDKKQNNLKQEIIVLWIDKNVNNYDNIYYQKLMNDNFTLKLKKFLLKIII